MKAPAPCFLPRVGLPPLTLPQLAPALPGPLTDDRRGGLPNGVAFAEVGPRRQRHPSEEAVRDRRHDEVRRIWLRRMWAALSWY